MSNTCLKLFTARLRLSFARSGRIRRSILPALAALFSGGLAGLAFGAGCYELEPFLVCEQDFTCPPKLKDGGTDADPSADGSGSTDGGGTIAQCVEAKDCPQPESALCGSAACINGQCTLSYNTGPTVSQVRGDCKRLECDGAGHLFTVLEPTDFYNDGRECTTDTCVGGAPVNKPLTNGLSCPEIGFGHCYEGECVECVGSIPGASDCPGAQECDWIYCVPTECVMKNGMKDGQESGTDCGGSCYGCFPSETCNVNSDCFYGVCNAGLCALPEHNDGVQNDGETGVDCGCESCPKCPAGQGCLTGENCLSRVCWAGTCDAPSCKDGIENGVETGLDCGGECPACP